MPQTVKERILAQIEASTDKAFVRREFAQIGSYRQVSRALAELTEEKRLVKAGLGIWIKTRTRPSVVLGREGRIVTTPMADAMGAAFQAFPKLGYTVKINSLEEARLRGESTQIPMIQMVRVPGRIRRKIVVGGQELKYEIDKPRPR